MDIPTVAEIRSAKKSNPQEAQLKKRITLKVISLHLLSTEEGLVCNLQNKRGVKICLDDPSGDGRLIRRVDAASDAEPVPSTDAGFASRVQPRAVRLA